MCSVTIAEWPPRAPLGGVVDGCWRRDPDTGSNLREAEFVGCGMRSRDSHPLRFRPRLSSLARHLSPWRHASSRDRANGEPLTP